MSFGKDSYCLSDSQAEESNAGWCVVYTRTNHERTVGQLLREQDLESYLPLYTRERKWSDRTKRAQSVLFPNYIFVRLTTERRYLVDRVPGVVSLITAGGMEQRVPDEEVAAIQRVLASALPVEPHLGFVPGEAVAVEQGPLKGTTGIYVESGKHGRVVVQVKLLQRGLCVPVERAWVRPIGSELPMELRPVAARLQERG